ncbi:MAG: hypothetical protein ACLSCV_10990 [Acutalibacteraceae bacterium]
MQENSLANYFEVMDSLSEMIQKGLLILYLLIN